MIAHAATDDGRETLFKRWLEQHTGLVFKVARTFAPSDADRDDLVQEILLQLWRSLPRFEGRAKESTWIYRVALNTALARHHGEPDATGRHWLRHASAMRNGRKTRRKDDFIAAARRALRRVRKRPA
jgi:RNA polymerase sigma factor (sigma-70 family)